MSDFSLSKSAESDDNKKPEYYIFHFVYLFSYSHFFEHRI